MSDYTGTLFPDKRLFYIYNGHLGPLIFQCKDLLSSTREVFTVGQQYCLVHVEKGLLLHQS